MERCTSPGKILIGVIAVAAVGLAGFLWLRLERAESRISDLERDLAKQRGKTAGSPSVVDPGSKSGETDGGKSSGHPNVTPKATEEEVRDLIGKLRAAILTRNFDAAEGIGKKLFAAGLPAARALISLFGNEQDPEVRRGVLHAIGQFQAEEVLRFLQAQLPLASDADTRRIVALGLINNPDPSSLDMIKTAFTTESDLHCQVAFLEAISTIPGDRASNELIEVYQRNSSAHLKMAALSGISKRSDPASRNLLRDILVTEQPTFARIYAMEGLANMGDKTALPLIENIAATSKDAVELEVARKAIEKLRGSE